jgi:hypothetical protein
MVKENSVRLFDYDDPNSFVSRLRKRRSHILRDMVEKVVLAKRQCHILDIGGEARYWLNTFGEEWLRRRAIHITMVNHSAEYVGSPVDGLFSIKIADACSLPYPNKSFDLVHSNSVIEHVGDCARQQAFAEETQRVGISYCLQTPARCFPLEPHVRFPWFQYLPSAARIWLFQHLPLGSYPRVSRAYAEQFDRELQLLTHRQLRELFPRGKIVRESLLGLTKSYMVVG